MTEPEPHVETIAIIGLAGRFPGARNVAEFWANLVAGQDSLTRLTDEQLAATGYDPATVRALPGFVGVRGLLEKPEWFDRAFFGLSPKEAEVIDPQQRVFLETAWDALEDAGLDPVRFPGLIGAFAGSSTNTYYANFVRLRPDLIEAVGAANAVLANEKDFLTTRLAYKLDLRGPALNVQTACSSSLVALCLACQSLLEHQCDAAIAGGVSITFPQERGYFYQEGGMTSPDGRCAPFSADANGTVFSSGVGAVVLKRLSEAVADGDQIYAVIRGQALNNDGAQKVSFAAPSVDGQTEVIALAQAVAGVTPESISYVETHGTATPLGDPIELAALTQVFGPAVSARQSIPIGSAKGNIGHLDATSGIVGVIKTALALRHGLIPASLHCATPNPALQLADGPFFVNPALRPWPRGPVPRRAGVSSFGVGSTNAHLILEEAPLLPASAPGRATELLVLSAKTATALDQRASELAAHLEAHPEVPLADAAFTLQTGRQLFQHRRAFVARTTAEASAALRAPARLQRVEDRTATPVAFLFPGQGTQYVRMGAQLYTSEPAFRAALDECAEILRGDIGLDLRDLLFAQTPEAEAQLRETRYTQPAIFALDYALAQWWLSLGLQPSALLGHSVGEFAAAVIAGIFSLADGARLVATRARLVQALPGGAMLAVRVSEAEAQEFLTDPQVALAAVNSPRLCVLSGPFEAIEAIEALLQQRAIAARRLATSHAFHSPMVAAVVAPLAAAVRGITLHAPTLPIVSSVTGDWLTAAQATDPQYWATHLTATVRFADGVGRLLTAAGSALLEVGPGQALSQLARQHAARTPRHEVIHSIAEDSAEDESVATALGRLWLTGVPLDWSRVRAGEKRRRISLPSYPFERQRYFADLPAGAPLPLVTAITDGEPPVAAGFAHAAAPIVAEAAVPVASTPEPPAEASLLDQVKTVLGELSGLDLAAEPASAGFLELGFDSLFLSQAAMALSRKFGVKVTFRQLLKETSTLETLAAFLAENRPATGATKAPSTATPAPSAPATVSATPTAHGPYRPVRRELAGQLTAAQEAWLADFIQRYAARTAGSKAHTQKHRAHFADPRAVSGFKQAWKEMVYPLVVDRSAGVRLWDIDGNEWIDVTLAFGAAMLGHQPPFVMEAIAEQMTKGMEIGPTSPLAGEVAAMLCEITGMDRVCFCNTGSEAVTGALRVARTVSGRPRIVYFSHAYHGIDNEVLGRAIPTGAAPIAPGIPAEALANALIFDYGDPQALEIIAAQADDIAAVLVEPVQSRHPGFQPRTFLQQLRTLTEQHGIALIFDEVVTGFRCAPGGAQEHFGIRADLASYGKIIGGGLPIGVIAGRREYMDAFDGGTWQFGDDSFPEAAVTFFAGTFVRHPLALAAAKAVLLYLKKEGPALQENLAQRTTEMVGRINTALAGTPFSAEHFTSNWYLNITSDFKPTGLLYALLRQRGIHIWEARPCFVSSVHTAADLDRVVAAITDSVAELEAAGFFTRATASAPARTATMPMAESQREVWLVCQQDPMASSACNETWTLHLDGPLNVSAFRTAVQTIVDRHDALRCTFSKNGETLSIAAALALDVPLIDLEPLSPAERDAQFATLRAAEGARVFDLQRGPLLALTLVRLAANEHALIFNAHHLTCDGWSCDVLLHELAELYSAGTEGRAPGLPVAMQMREYQQWETEMRAGADFAADTAFWLEQYRTIPPALTLPGDRPYPRFRSYRGNAEELLLPVEFSQALAKLGATHGATFFTVLLAGFKTLLFRLSGETDLAVGVPSAGQNLTDGEHLIGHCVNMLPLRTQLSGSQTFAELLAGIQTTVLEAFEHQRLTFGSLLQNLIVPRTPGRIPLVPVTFNLDPPLSHIHFSGLAQRLENNPRSAFQFDLGFNCDTTPEGFRVVCSYNTDLFDGATIQRWLGHFHSLLAAAVANPQQPLVRFLPQGDVTLRSAGDRRIKLHGQEVDLGEIEAALLRQPGVGECAVVSRTQPSGAPQLIAYVVRATPPTVQLWPSSPSAGKELFYDDMLYNAMAHDKSRHELYRRAFEKTVRGKTVVDVGTGRDALLAVMCVEAGATKVYGIEILEQPAQQARALVEKLGLADRIEIIHGRSQDVEVPEKVDICISENVGHIGGAEGGDLMIIDSHRFLRPGGLIIPGRCATKIAAITMPEDFLAQPQFEPLGAYYARQAWASAGYPHDFRLCVVGTTREFLSSTEALFEEIDFTQPAVPESEREIRLTIQRTTRIDGFLLWLQLETVPGVVLEAIDAQDAWLPIYLPVFYPSIEVTAGDEIHAVVRGRLAENKTNRDYHITGSVRRQHGAAVEFAYDSWHYKQAFQHSPFYAQLFREGSVPVYAPAPPIEEAALTDVLLDSLPERTVPARISVRDHLPRTADGQIDRLALAESEPRLTAEERQRLLVEWNDTARPFPANLGIHRVFEEQAARHPESTAVVAAGQSLTYAMLNARANRLARHLQKHGVAPGVCVALCLERSAELIVGILAILKAGAGYVPLDPSYPAERIALMLKTTDAGLVLTRVPFATALPQTSLQILDLDQLELPDETSANLDLPGSGDDLAYVMFTSGSTGLPKGVAVPHRGISRLVVNNDYAPFAAEDVVAFASNVCFDAATFEIWGALLNGGALVVTPPEVLLSPATLSAHLAATRIDTLFLTTSLFNQMAMTEPGMFAKLHHVVFGGEAADAEAVRRVLEAGKPQRLVNGYGPTETTTFAVCHNIEHANGARIPIGRPIANSQAYIFDEALEPVPVGVSGELYLGGPGVALGYYRAPKLTAERFLDTPHGRLYRTGDLACWRADGTIDCLGRADQQVKLRGFRVEPGEIETLLRGQPGVKDCRVIPCKESTGTNQLVAYFISNGFKPEPANLRQELARTLPAFMIPSAFIDVPNFPLTPNGKLDPHALPKPSAGAAERNTAMPPRNATEREVALLWERILGRKDLSVTDDFFALGGHSLLAIQLMGQVKDKFRVDLPARVLFDQPTIEGIAEFITAQRAPQRELLSLIPIQRGNAAQRPFFLVPGGWGGEIEFLVYAQLARHLQADFPLYGLKARGADGDHAPHRSVAEMAADYIAEIRSVQPHGPYLLGGECIGGIVAFEMACQLEAQGEKIDLLVLLDTDPPQRAELKRFCAAERAAERKRFWNARILQPLHSHREKLSRLSLPEKCRYVWDRTFRRGLRRGAVPAPTTIERKVLKDYPRTLLAHHFGAYGGKVTLLLDTETHAEYGTLSWDEVKVGALEVHILPGDHLTYIREHAPNVATKLRELISQANPLLL